MKALTDLRARGSHSVIASILPLVVRPAWPLVGKDVSRDNGSEIGPACWTAWACFPLLLALCSLLVSPRKSTAYCTHRKIVT